MKIFPNPAKTETQISLSAFEKQKINVSAYTPDGRLVITLFDGIMEQGIYHCSFGSGVLPGTYLLTANNITHKTVTKVILLN